MILDNRDSTSRWRGDPQVVRYANKCPLFGIRSPMPERPRWGRKADVAENAVENPLWVNSACPLRSSIQAPLGQPPRVLRPVHPVRHISERLLPVIC